MKLDILAFGAHPDDVELSCSGTILTHIKQGKKAGIVDLTKGELGTRGTPELRLEEAEKAAGILGVEVRENAGFKDGFFINDEVHQRKVITYIRKYRPEIVLANAIKDRHIDHGKGADLVRSACFLSGLRKIETAINGEPQEAWRPENIFYSIQDRMIKPDIVVDITPEWENKIKAIKAFKSQFYDPDSSEPESYISTPDFLKFIEARALEMGHSIGVKYGEGFVSEKQLGSKTLFC